jgi:hypothetical protein
MICINCTFHYSVWSFHLLFSCKFWNVWHQLICWFNVSWTLSFLDVVNVLESIWLMSLHVVLPHVSLFRCTCSGCCSFCYHLRVGLTPVFECLLHHLWLPLVLVLFYGYSWLNDMPMLQTPGIRLFMVSGYWCWLHYSHTSVSPAI